MEVDTSVRTSNLKGGDHKYWVLHFLDNSEWTCNVRREDESHMRNSFCHIL